MDLAKYAVTAVVVEGRSVRAVAASTGRSKSWVARHVQLYREGGEAALAPRKRGPVTALNRTSALTEDIIVAMRKELSDQGYDAGARTLRYHLAERGHEVPALATIHRVLQRRGFVTPQPQKRPRSSWIRFESHLPNETWQSVEIVNFIDDYSRAVLCSSVVRVALAADVVRLFFATTDLYGLPASVLSDNGAIYTSTYRGSHSGLEIELAQLGIRFKHGKPYHPQTQGKVERYHQTLKKWLRKQAPAASIEELQAQIDGFVHYYNEQRPHQARGCPPMRAWRELDKATPELNGQRLLAKTRVRHDHVDRWGSVTLRYRRTLHHIGVGRPNRGKRVLILVADLDVRVIDEDGVLLRHFELDPSVDYQAKSRDIV
jgi:transposase InsO family protein